MASIIQELQRKQAGFIATQKAINKRHRSPCVEKNDESGNIIKVTYNPSRDSFGIESYIDNAYTHRMCVNSIQAGFILEILDSLLREGFVKEYQP